MATMNISLPKPMREWVEQQIQGGRYSNNSDYVRDLIRRDQEQRVKVFVLQQAITEGLESGLDGKLDMAEIKRLAKSQVGIGSDV